LSHDGGEALDVAVFAYLEEVESSSTPIQPLLFRRTITPTVSYVSEGRVLLSHRTVVKNPCDKLNGINTAGNNSTANNNSGTTNTANNNSGGTDNPSTNTTGKKSNLDCDDSVRVGSPEVVTQPGTRDKWQYASEKIEQLTLTMEPVAWRFRKGVSIRLRLTGADTDNFDYEATARKTERRPRLPRMWKLVMSAENRAWLKLPCMQPNTHW